MAEVKGQSLEIEVNGLEGLSNVANSLVDFADDYKVWLLDGEMGAGKTTFTKSICESFGVMDVVNSPTFSIVNEYRDHRDEAYYHFDFYRIKDEQEAMDIGADEYFYSGAHCFIEWSSKIPSLIPDKYLEVNIEITGSESRTIKCIKHG